MNRIILWSLLALSLFQGPALAGNRKTEHLLPSQSSRAVSSAEKNLAAGQSFLERNKKQSGVLTLPSGLQYKIVKEGNGLPPGPTDFVTVNYRGTLIDGTEFDSSYAHNAPATFAVNAVIPGWSEALQLMKPGSKWTITVPPNLAYGANGAGRLIGPHTTLNFDIELISVKPMLDEHSDSLEEIEED